VGHGIAARGRGRGLVAAPHGAPTQNQQEQGLAQAVLEQQVADVANATALHAATQAVVAAARQAIGRFKVLPKSCHR
jgi:hypothetical protein